jgi:hypothetical protein
MTARHRKRSTYRDPDIEADEMCGTFEATVILTVLTVGAVVMAVLALHGVGRWLGLS